MILKYNIRKIPNVVFSNEILSGINKADLEESLTNEIGFCDLHLENFNFIANMMMQLPVGGAFSIVN